MMNVVCTHVLVKLTLREDVELPRAMAMMREEMLATADLYLRGSIVQWYSLLDERGVLFVFGVTDVEVVRGLMEGLPFVKEGLVDLTYTRLGPLQPMRTLLGVG